MIQYWIVYSPKERRLAARQVKDLTLFDFFFDLLPEDDEKSGLKYSLFALGEYVRNRPQVSAVYSAIQGLRHLHEPRVWRVLRNDFD